MQYHTIFGTFGPKWALSGPPGAQKDPIPGGHSCNIGNAPSLVGKKLKTVICVFWMYIWYGITLTKMGKEMGKLKKNFNTYIWQNVWFFRPEEILTISCKIRCQSFNFICQALEQSLKFANRSYRLKEYICFQVFLKITFFMANM